VEHCPVDVKGGVENSYGKINILLQTFISRGYVDSFSLVSDQGYVAQVKIFSLKGPCLLFLSILEKAIRYIRIKGNPKIMVQFHYK